MERAAFMNSMILSEDDYYRRLYRQHPEGYDQPVHTWSEFAQRYAQRMNPEDKTPLLPSAPTPMDEVFDETSFFPQDLFTETTAVINAPYCPPFLHHLTFIKLIYVVRGSCTFYCDGQERMLRRGSICIVAPDVEQAVFSFHDEDIVLNLLIRRSTFLESFHELLGGQENVITSFFWKMLYNRPDGRVLLLDGEPDPELEEYAIDLFIEATQAQPKSRLAMKSLMMLVLGCVVRDQRRKSITHLPGVSVRRYPMIEYQQYMQRHLETVSLPEMAQAFYLSEGYLSRYIRRETGSTFSQLLLRMRMKTASELLINTDFSIETIVLSVGYRDQSIFFRNFRSFYGMTPMTYRKMRRSRQFIW